ncbi:MarR family EPS-associated transcriptional regulator [Candidatus Omnitrophota bacterium]
MKNLEETIKLLDHIQQNPEATQRELVDELDISLGKVNFLIKSLANTGIIKLKRFKNSRNKKGYLYLLTPDGIRKKTSYLQRYLEEKMQEYDRLRTQIEALKNQVSDVNKQKDGRDHA